MTPAAKRCCAQHACPHIVCCGMVPSLLVEIVAARRAPQQLAVRVDRGNAVAGGSHQGRERRRGAGGIAAGVAVEPAAPRQRAGAAPHHTLQACTGRAGAACICTCTRHPAALCPGMHALPASAHRRRSHCARRRWRRAATPQARHAPPHASAPAASAAARTRAAHVLSAARAAMPAACRAVTLPQQCSAACAAPPPGTAPPQPPAAAPRQQALARGGHATVPPGAGTGVAAPVPRLRLQQDLPVACAAPA